LLFAKFDKDGPKIKDLALWVNKMPFDEIDGYTLISSKELVDKLTQILGPKKIKEFLKVKIQFLVNGGDNNGFITFTYMSMSRPIRYMSARLSMKKNYNVFGMGLKEKWNLIT
jgi:hypothetical protein